MIGLIFRRGNMFIEIERHRAGMPTLRLLLLNGDLEFND
jgi:hypothetical protein